MECDKSVILYCGPFRLQIIAVLGKLMLDSLDTSEIIRMKLYRVYIELTRNVYLYSAERLYQKNSSDAGVGKVYLRSTESSYTCTTFNKILNEHVDTLINNCNSINNNTELELRRIKSEFRKSAQFDELGAHIGLIMIKIYSGNPLQFQIIEDNIKKTKFFEITATINRI